MSRLRRIQLPLDISMGHMAVTMGSKEKIFAQPAEGFETHIAFVLPPETTKLVPGKYSVEHAGENVQVLIERVISSEQDPIVRFGGDIFIHSKQGFPPLRIDDVSDNRGIYPALLVAVIFDRRTDEFENEIAPQREDGDLLEGPTSAEKLAALRVLRTLFRSDAYPERGAHLHYDDISTFFSGVRSKASGGFELVRVSALTTREAYREAVYDKVVGFASLGEVVSRLREHQRAINSEHDLQLQVIDALTRLKEHVEGKRWIDPFWDGNPSELVGGGARSDGITPKNEIRIQPTIYIILHELLGPLGITVLRDANAGAGPIDIACSFTTTDFRRLIVGIEVKLAHHKELKKGMRSQLPAYLRSLESAHGIYLIMWFKSGSGKGFPEPKQHSLNELSTWLATESTASNADNKMKIVPVTLPIALPHPGAKENCSTTPILRTGTTCYLKQARATAAARFSTPSSS